MIEEKINCIRSKWYHFMSSSIQMADEPELK